MRTFLYVTVSPSACKKEFKATTNINNTVPKKIILIYSTPSIVTSSDEFINKNTFSAKVKPKIDTAIEIMIA